MNRRQLTLLTVISLAFAAGIALRLNDLSLYTDSTRYIIWATSLSQGDGWIDRTQPEPESYVVNAPLYPAFLVPSQWLAPMSLIAGKALTGVYGLAALLLFAAWSRRSLGSGPSIAATALLAVTPLALVIFSEALSEAPFLALVWASLVILERRDEETARRWELALLVTAMAFLPLLREIGALFVAAAVVHLALRRQWRLAALVVLAAGCTEALWSYRNLVLVGVPADAQTANVQFVFERFTTGAGASLIEEWMRRAALNIHAYRYELSGMLFVPLPLNLIRDPSAGFAGLVSVLQAVKPYVFIVALPAVGYGLIVDLRRRGTAIMRLLFLVLYIGVILIYPLQDIRFFLPVLPFALFYAFRAGLDAVQRWPQMQVRIALIAVAAAIGCVNLWATVELLNSNRSYLRALSEAVSGVAPRLPGGYYATPWSLMGRWIDEHVPRDAVLASPAKEIVPFVGGRTVVEINRAVPLPMFDMLLRDHDVTYVLTPIVRSGVRAYEFHLAESPHFRFDSVAAYGWLVLLRATPQLRQGTDPDVGPPPDSLRTISDILRVARNDILTERYPAAESLLASIRAVDPGNAEIAYQRVVAAALGAAPEVAVAMQEELFSTPRATSYVPPGRMLLAIADLRMAADTPGLEPPARAQKLYEAARTAWDLGYRRAAVSFATRAVAAEPQHFEALLWKMHFLFQTGDTLGGRACLRNLEAIDRSNAVVAGFRRIDSLASTLRRARTKQEVARTHLAIAAVYEEIGLPEEAKDSAQRAIAAGLEDAGRAAIAEILQRQGRTFGADRYAHPSTPPLDSR